MQRSRLKLWILVAAVSLAINLAGASAYGAGMTVTNPGGGVFDGTPFSLGWQFTANSNFVVTDLGIFDDTGSGLVAQADIGLFTNAGALLASTSLAAGTGSPLIDGFRYGSVASTPLSAGTTYVIASYYPGNYYDFAVSNGPAFSVDPAINFDSFARSASASSLVFPTTSSASDRAYVGPNFLLVPEPTTLVLLGFGLAALGFKRKKVSAA